MDGLVTWEDLNVLPFGSYDILIGMDWLKAQENDLIVTKRPLKCLDEEAT